MNLLIREVRREDLPALLGLYRQLSARETLEETPAHERAWAELQAQPGVRVLVAEVAGQVVGTLNLALIPGLARGGRPFGVVESVVTEAAVRGQGVGRALLAEAERRAQAAGAYKVMLLTGVGRWPARAFYEKCGYDGSAKVAFEKRWL